MYDDSTVARAKELVCKNYGEKELDAKAGKFLLDSAAAHDDDDDEYIPKLFPVDVRPGDKVALCSIGTTTHAEDATKVVPTNERFWARVISATPCGKVTAWPQANLQWSDVSPDAPVWFPMHSIMAVERGALWL